MTAESTADNYQLYDHYNESRIYCMLSKRPATMKKITLALANHTKSKKKALRIWRSGNRHCVCAEGLGFDPLAG